MSTVSAHDTLQAVLTKLEQAQRLIQNPLPPPDMPVQMELLLEEMISDIRQELGIKQWPEPTVEPPDLETLQEWLLDSICEATDGCIVEHDGRCSHGHPSWFLRLGLI